jgi:hypothetical protein
MRQNVEGGITCGRNDRAQIDGLARQALRHHAPGIDPQDLGNRPAEQLGRLHAEEPGRRAGCLK